MGCYDSPSFTIIHNYSIYTGCIMIEDHSIYGL